MSNMRGLFNDHVGTHAMAFVLCFARGFQHHISSGSRSLVERVLQCMAGHGQKSPRQVLLAAR
jgi:hypothetical protein